jgi:hypothetical protein
LTRLLLILTFITTVTIPLLGQDEQIVLTFKHKTHEKRLRRLLFSPNTQYLKIRTIDSTYYLPTICSITDTSLIALQRNDTIVVPLKNIHLIKKMNGHAEGVGYIVLGMGMIGFAIGVPISWIEKGGKGAVEQIIGTVAVTSISLPFIIIGSITTRYNMKKWRVYALSRQKRE